MQALTDTTAALSTVYDSVWVNPDAVGTTFESAMLADDKLFVVLAVVLLIWFGLLAFLFVTDRKIARLERDVDAHVGPSDAA